MSIRIRYILVATMLIGMLLLSASLVLAQAGPTDVQEGQQFPMGLSTISYQGRVTVNGQPYDGTGYFMFAILDSQGDYTWNSDIIVQAQGANQQIGAPQNPIPLPVKNGLFSVRLGAAPDMNPIPPDAVTDPDAVLRVWFGPDANHPTQLPDRPFSSVPWALMADTLDGFDSSEFALANHDHWGETWSGNGTGLELQSLDGWGLNVTTDSGNDYATAIHGSAGSSSGKTVGVWGETQSSSDEAMGVWGQANAAGGQTYGVFGQNSSTDDGAAGVFGWAQGNSGHVYGVKGQSDSQFGIGVYGFAQDSVGVKGESGTWVGVYGVRGSQSLKAPFPGAGVWGDSADAPGVFGTSDQAAGVFGTSPITGTVGIATSDTGITVGVYGESFSPIGDGVVGKGVNGVRGESTSANGVGVLGLNRDGGRAAIFVGETAEAAAPQSHVVEIRNVAAGGAGPDGLAIEMPFESEKPGSNVNFITFFSGNSTAVGAIEGNGSGGVVYKSGGADFAELLPAVDGLEPGDVVVIGPDGTLTRSSKANQSNVAGVYSTAPGFLGGMSPDMEKQDGDAFQDRAPVAIVGIVPVKVSAENGAIHPGDLLTASNTPGHAMKADPVRVGDVEFYRPGTIIGKALEPLDEGTGVIRVLITLH